MKFAYHPHFGFDFFSGEPQLLLRPEVRIIIHGPIGSQEYHALVDTGADYTIIPMSIAEELGISLSPILGKPPVAFGGQTLESKCGDVEFELRCEEESYRWTTTVLFHESKQEDVVLGHIGFLHNFHATFDGFAMELTLTPVPDFPL